MPALETIALVLLGFFGGIGLMIWGYMSFKQYQVIRDTPTSKIQSISVGDTEIKGRIKPYSNDRIYQNPLTKDDTIYYALEIEEHHEDDDGGDWHTVETEHMGTKFIVEDETGEIVVLIDEPQFEFKEENVKREKFVIGPNKDAPDVLKKYEDGDSAFVPDFLENEKYRVTVKSIEPEQEVFVFGEAEIRDSVSSTKNEDNLIITNPDSTVVTEDEVTNESSTVFDNYGTPFIISTKGEDAIQKDFKRSGPFGLIVGLISSAISLYIILGWIL